MREIRITETSSGYCVQENDRFVGYLGFDETLGIVAEWLIRKQPLHWSRTYEDQAKSNPWTFERYGAVAGLLTHTPLAEPNPKRVTAEFLFNPAA